MRKLSELDKYRVENPFFRATENSGAFKVYVDGRSLYVIASVDDCGVDGYWEHVSVSLKNQSRCPTWEEMCAVKDMFFFPEEECIQFHPKHSQYVNLHVYTLHIWRPVSGNLRYPGSADIKGCIMCDAENCAFNPKGICMYPMVYGEEPGLDFNGCKGFCYKEEK